MRPFSYPLTDRTKSSLHESHATYSACSTKYKHFFVMRSVLSSNGGANVWVSLAFCRFLHAFGAWAWEKKRAFSQMSGWMGLHLSMRNAMCIFRSAWGKNMQLQNFDLLLYLKYKSVYAIQWCFPIRQLFCWFFGLCPPFSPTLSGPVLLAFQNTMLDVEHNRALYIVNAWRTYTVVPCSCPLCNVIIYLHLFTAPKCV